MSNDQLFDRFEALTFDDVVVVPGYSNVLPDTVDTTARFAGDIELAVPLVSAAMDKVTEARLAIAIAREVASASSTATWPSPTRRPRCRRSSAVRAA